jgi:L-ascorbate metabolism protein UlaG (beta-lactamase superfamily)
VANRQFIKNVKWLGHAGFLLSGKRLIYIDPVNLKFPDVGDIILVTHAHSGHCSPEEIKWLRKGSTVIVAPKSCASSFQGDVRIIQPGDTIIVKEIKIEVVPAYNLTKKDHPKEAGGVGYILSPIDGMRIYHAGDTDWIPDLYDVICDIALLPVGGGSTMDAIEAARAANTLKPKVAIPMHWGDGMGTRADAETFKELCEVEVEIMKPSG